MQLACNTEWEWVLTVTLLHCTELHCNWSASALVCSVTKGETEWEYTAECCYTVALHWVTLCRTTLVTQHCNKRLAHTGSCNSRATQLNEDTLLYSILCSTYIYCTMQLACRIHCWPQSTTLRKCTSYKDRDDLKTVWNQSPLRGSFGGEMP